MLVFLKKETRKFFFCYQEKQLLDMCTVRDTRTGRYAKVAKDQRMRDQVTMGASQDSVEDKTLTVVHGPDFVNVTFLNFCTTKKEIAKVNYP